MAKAKTENLENEVVEGKQEESAGQDKGQDRSKQRLLVIFKTDGIDDKVFPAKYRSLELHHRIIACRPTLGVAKKLGLDGGKGVTYDPKTGKVKRIRGSKGAKSYQFLFKEDANKNKISSYSLPVPSWVNMAIFAGSIGKALKAKDILKDCLGIVSPDGTVYSASELTELLEVSKIDDADNVQDTNKEPSKSDNTPVTTDDATNPTGDGAESDGNTNT